MSPFLNSEVSPLVKMPFGANFTTPMDETKQIQAQVKSETHPHFLLMPKLTLVDGGKGRTFKATQLCTILLLMGVGRKDLRFKSSPKRKSEHSTLQGESQAAVAAVPQGGPLTGGVLPDAGG